MAKSSVTKIYYVDPIELTKEIKKFKKTKVISEELGTMILKIARKYASRSNFSGYSYKEDFISDAVHRMIEQLDKINLKHPKCNVFAYLTQMCHFKFIAKITKEKKFQDTKNRLRDDYFAEIENEEHITYRKNPEEEKQNKS